MEKQKNKYIAFLIMLIIYLAITTSGLIYLDLWAYGKFTFFGYLGVFLILLLISFWLDPLIRILTLKRSFSDSGLLISFISLTIVPPFIRQNHLDLPFEQLKKIKYSEEKRGHQFTIDFLTTEKTSYTIKAPYSPEVDAWLKAAPQMIPNRVEVFVGSHVKDNENFLCHILQTAPAIALDLNLNKKIAADLPAPLQVFCNRKKPEPPRRRRHR